MKPLYLETRVRVLLDGPALRVCASGQADRLFPLRRVSRVVAKGHSDWDTRALLACADRGITVSFLARDGSIRARLLGGADKREELAQRLTDLLDRPDWLDEYRTWRAALEHRYAREAARQLGVALKPHMGFDILHRAVERALCRRLDRQEVNLMRECIAGLLGSRILQELRRHGLTGDSEALIHAGFHLIEDLAGICWWPLALDAIDWIATCAASGSLTVLERRDVVEFFERRERRTVVEIAELVQRLYHWAMEETA